MTISKSGFLAALLAMGALGAGCGDDAAAAEEPTEEETSGAETDTPAHDEPAATATSDETPPEEGTSDETPPSDDTPAPAPTEE